MAGSARACRRCEIACPTTCATGERGPDHESLPFKSLYLLDDEWAAEIANRTMHGVMHLGWVPDGSAATEARWPFW